MSSTIGVKLNVEGESNFKKALSEVNSQLKLVKSELNTVASAYDKNDKSVENLTAQNKVLDKEIATQKQKIELLKSAVEESTEKYGENSNKTRSWQTQLNNAQTALNKMENQVESNNKDLENMDEKLDDVSDGMSSTNSTMSSWSVTLGNLAANAIQQVIDKCVDLAKETIELGTSTETAFAQLETIAGAENIDDLTESLTELSTETGISASDLATTAYNAISAGTSAENAAEMVEAASKLATAGFTDSENALSVLTTAISAYGLSEEEVTNISDSLIQVQNLGMTTLDELSTSMGKAISTASAYNVNLSNLESAYVSLTKNGISTEESTTYLRSMLKELGDTSSDVALIIQEQTGQSFSELMNEGYSLGDVLGILYDYCNNDATALTNLWSSAEAGTASNAIVSQGLDAFNENLEAIGDSSGATEDAYSTMTDTMEFKTSTLQTSFEALGLELYDEIEPALNDLIDFVNDSVIPALDTLIDNLPSLLVLLGGIAAAFLASKIAIAAETVEKLTNTAATEGLTVAQAALNALGTPVIVGLIVAALAALIAIIVAVVRHWDEITAAMESFGEKVEEVFTKFTDWLDGIKTTISDWFTSVKTKVSNSLTEAKDTVKTWFSDLIKKVKTFFSDLWKKFKSGLSSLWTKIKNVFTGEDGWTTKIKKIGKDLITGLWKGINDKVEWLKSKISGFCSTVTDWFKDLFDENSPSKITEGIGGYLTIGLGNGIVGSAGAAIDAASSVADSVVSAFDDASDDVSASLSSGTFSVDTSLGNLTSNIVATSSNDTLSMLTELTNAVVIYLPYLSTMASKSFSVSLDGKVISNTVYNYLNSSQQRKLLSLGVR